MQSKIETHFVRLYVLAVMIWYITWLVAYPRDLGAVELAFTFVRCGIVSCSGYLAWKPHTMDAWKLLAALVTLDSVGSVLSYTVTDFEPTESFLGQSIRLLMYGFGIVLVCVKGVEYSRIYWEEQNGK